MIKYIISSLLVIALFGNCKSDKEEAINNLEPIFMLKTEGKMDNMDYLVYSVILASMYSIALVLLHSVLNRSSKSKESDFCELLINENPDIDAVIGYDFSSKNDSVYILNNKLDVVPKGLSLIAKDEIDNILNTQQIKYGWEEYCDMEIDSRGFDEISKIGFDLNENQGLIQFNRCAKYMAANEASLHLKKGDNT